MKRQIEKVGLLGSGVMGMGISAHLAAAGLEVVMLDIVPPELSDEDKKKGITVDDPDFRNRFAAGALARALKQNPQSGPFLHRDDAELITIGNFEDHAHLLKECVAKNWNKQAIISTNTSGIPLREISEKMKPEMKKVFLGTHFFNPVRFMHLLEVIPFKETDKKVVSFIADFCEKRLGKGIVYGKDTPNFIANRIGVAGMIGTINLMQELGMKIDETDQIFGTPLGRPKSALFRTADMAGLDTLVHVAHNTTQYVKPGEAKKYFTLPEWIEGMVEKNLLGNKTGSGFYKRIDKKTFKIIDPETLEYVDQSGEKFESLKLSGFTADVGTRIKNVIKGEGRESQFAKRAIYDQLIYAAERVGEICDSVLGSRRAWPTWKPGATRSPRSSRTSGRPMSRASTRRRPARSTITTSRRRIISRSRKAKMSSIWST
jgi:3-hydroxyacyl-CoA dehydrogenase